jgi:hypothetical protein
MIREARNLRITTEDAMSTTDTIREQSLSIVECDVPDGMTLREYRDGRCRPSRWEKARLGLLGAGVVGLVAETWATRRRSP